jgi:hypothetical protein
LLSKLKPTLGCKADDDDDDDEEEDLHAALTNTTFCPHCVRFSDYSQYFPTQNYAARLVMKMGSFFETRTGF